MATEKNRGLDLNGIESLEPMILMSASAADVDAATLDDATEGNDVMIALEAGSLMDGNAGHDILIGLAGDNYLKGGAGHDMLIAIRGDNVIDGGDGQDTLVYWGGNRADYKVTDKGFGILEIDNGRSSDFVTNVEEIQFRDGSYSVADLFKADSAPAASTPLVIDAVAPIDAEDVPGEPVVPVIVDPPVVEETVEITTPQLPVENVIVDEISEEDADEVEVVEEELTEEELTKEEVVADEIEEGNAEEIVVVEEELTDEETEVVEEEEVENEVIVDEIMDEENDEIVVVEEDLTDEVTEEVEPGTDEDDEVWACVDHWMNNCAPECDLEIAYDEEEVIVVEEPVDCVVEPPVVEESDGHDNYDDNWSYATPAYTECNLFGWIEPGLTNCVSIFDEVCDQNYNSRNDHGWSWGGWSQWFGCW